MYEKGQGIAQNFTKAIEWYSKAANQGFADAQYNLGGIYYNGLGVLQNNTKAVEWWIKAANQGHVRAKSRLAESQ